MLFLRGDFIVQNLSCSALFRRTAAVLVYAVSFLTGSANAALVHVSIDTSSIAGANAQLIFDLTDFDGVDDNSVQITSFSAPGAALCSAAAFPDGSAVTGALPGNTTLSELPGFALVSLSQALTLGNSISFYLNITENNAGLGPGPDSVTVGLWDETLSQLLLPSNDPIGHVSVSLLGLGNILVESFAPDVRARLLDRPLPSPAPVWLIGLLLTGILRRELIRH